MTFKGRSPRRDDDSHAPPSTRCLVGLRRALAALRSPRGDVGQIDAEEERLERQTDEGAQELRSPTRTREVVIAGGGMWPEDELGDTMIINMGPQHPSTHGVLRLMMELDGEDVLRIKPVVGYLHTGMEKTGEELTYVQGMHERHAHGLRGAVLERARLLARGREAARHRSAATRASGSA